jgi:hypothetical protein
MSMETNRSPQQPPVKTGTGADAPPERYEHSDADVPMLFKLGLWLFVVLVVIFFGMRWTFDYYAKSQTLGPPVSPFESGNVRVLPPTPRLQVAPQAELRTYCQAQQQELTTYDWVDRANGVTRVPIDRAMKKLLERGLPVRPANESPTPAGAAPAEAPSPASGSAAAAMELGPCGFLLEATKPAGESREKESGAKE